MFSSAAAQEDARWRKSSYTNAGNDPQCVEVACFEQARAVRDSKNQAGGALAFSAGAFRMFIAEIGTGSFDRP